MRSAPRVEEWGEGLAVLATHFPLLAPAGRDTRPGDHLLDNDDLLKPLRARSGPTLVLSGHFHTRAAHTDGRLLQLIFPALVEVPTFYSIVGLSEHEGRYQVTRTVHALDDGVAGPEAETWEFDGSGWV
jgi:hypothetical protein